MRTAMLFPALLILAACGDDASNPADTGTDPGTADLAGDPGTADVPADGSDATFPDEGTADPGGSDPGAPDAVPETGGEDPGAQDPGPSDAPGLDAFECGPGALCEGHYNYMFITSTTYVLGSIGIAGADKACQDRAKAGGLPAGGYVAWLSTTAQDARTRLGKASGWIRPDRRPFARNKADLLKGLVLYPPMLDEFGKPTPYEKVLVGTLPDGTVAEKNCMDWTSTDPAGNVAAGYSNAGNERWTSWLTYFCNRETPIYCLGTDVQLGLPAPGATGRAAFASAGQFKPDGGLAGADGLCQGEAAWASLTGTFKALLATSAASAMSRFSEGADWVRPDGIPVWESAADARGGATPLAPILVQADGTRSASEFAWAGAPSTTDVAQFSCEDWSSALLTKNGSTATLYYVAEDWFGAGFSENCNRSADKDIRVICLQD